MINPLVRVALNYCRLHCHEAVMANLIAAETVAFPKIFYKIGDGARVETFPTQSWLVETSNDDHRH